MVKRKIIEINEDLCNGCKQCIPNCHEGALQIIDGKCRLISDLFCDGLGACIGHCPTGAMKIIEREVEAYDERKTMEEKIVPKGKNTINAHINHLKDHGATEFYDQTIAYLEENGIDYTINEKKQTFTACSGSAPKIMNNPVHTLAKPMIFNNSNQVTELRQWPVQLHLVPIHAPFFRNSHLLIATDCVGFANPNFHSQLLHGKSLVICCPKLDNGVTYVEKLSEIFKHNTLRSVTIAIMEVPCCRGLLRIVNEALDKSGKNIPVIKEIVNTDGSIR